MKSTIFRRTIVILILAGSLLLPAVAAFASAGTASAAAVPGKVTMVDFGANTCVPCKMMAPILEELEKEYTGRAAILFIDVWKNPEVGRKYGIQLIPTQIFYDARGKEVFRHEGFMDKAAIVAQLDKLGVR